MTSNKIELSVIIPCYNEELVISESYKRLTVVLKQTGKSYELLFVNDGSADKTESILATLAETDPAVKVISFSKNFGHQPAVSAGLKYCVGELAVIIDADLQDPPEVILEMLRIQNEEKANVVYGVRKHRKGESAFKLLTAKIFYRLLNRMSEVQIPVDTGDFRLVDRNIIDNFNNLKEKNKYIRGLISWFGFKQVPVYYNRDERFAGETKFPFKKMFRFATNSLLYFSRKPLKIASVVGMICIGLGLFYLLLNLYYWFFHLRTMVTGWTSLVVIIVFFGGIQLLTIGVLGQYIGILFDEIKDRPEFLVSRTINTEKLKDDKK